MIEEDTLKAVDIKSIEPYELIALSELERFRRGREDAYKDQPPHEEHALLVEEQVLSGVLRFHGSAKGNRPTERRRLGRHRGSLRGKELIKVLLNLPAERTTAGELGLGTKLALRLADSYPQRTRSAAHRPGSLNC